jgi:hypothetical protein
MSTITTTDGTQTHGMGSTLKDQVNRELLAFFEA